VPGDTLEGRKIALPEGYYHMRQWDMSLEDAMPEDEDRRKVNGPKGQPVTIEKREIYGHTFERVDHKAADGHIDTIIDGKKRKGDKDFKG
jgi:hypothetical protein